MAGRSRLSFLTSSSFQLPLIWVPKETGEVRDEPSMSVRGALVLGVHRVGGWMLKATFPDASDFCVHRSARSWAMRSSLLFGSLWGSGE